MFSETERSKDSCLFLDLTVILAGAQQLCTFFYPCRYNFCY